MYSISNFYFTFYLCGGAYGPNAPPAYTGVNSIAGRQSSDMGRHGRLPVCRIIRQLAELTAARKTAKYAALESRYLFQRETRLLRAVAKYSLVFSAAGV